MRQAATHEWQRVLPLTLVVSAGLHLVAALLVEVPQPGGSGGTQPGLRLLLQRGDAADKATPSAAPTEARRSGQAGADRYFDKTEVDVAARPVSRTPLVIPERAYHSRLAGTVRARIFIGADGGVDKVEILGAEPVRGLFEDAALDALRGMRYQAARIGGRAVKSQKLVEVVFNPRADDPNPRE